MKFNKLFSIAFVLSMIIVSTVESTNVALADGPYGPDGCIQGYVWREAGPADHVCVTPQTRAQAAFDNQQASQRRYQQLTFLPATWDGRSNGIPANSIRLGEFTVEPICDSRGDAPKLAGNITGWACARPNGSQYDVTISDLDARCSATYGIGSLAVYDMSKPQHAYNWSCYRMSLDPNSPADGCVQGYVWRAAFPGDDVCVTPDVRSQAAYDNQHAAERVYHAPVRNITAYIKPGSGPNNFHVYMNVDGYKGSSLKVCVYLSNGKPIVDNMHNLIGNCQSVTASYDGTEWTDMYFGFNKTLGAGLYWAAVEVYVDGSNTYAFRSQQATFEIPGNI